MKTRPHHPTGISRVPGPRPASSHLGTEQPWEGRQSHSHFPGEKQAQKGQGARSGSHGWCVGRQAPKSPLLTNPAGRLRPPPSFLGRSPSHPWDCLPSKCPTCLWLETLELGERKHCPIPLPLAHLNSKYRLTMKDFKGYSHCSKIAWLIFAWWFRSFLSCLSKRCYSCD